MASNDGAEKMMKCTDLAKRIEEIRPGADVRDVARLCLLLTNASEDLTTLTSDQVLASAWKQMDLRLQAATDQHAAMTRELEFLARTDTHPLTTDQIWVLIRAIKVQGRMLQLYLGAGQSA